MKITLSCPRCQMLAHESNDDFLFQLWEFVSEEFNDVGYHKVKCKNGHDFVTVIQQMKFELLFEFGIFALADGYAREAVLNFAGALERFYEYCISVFLSDSGIDNEECTNAWKKIKNQSERQFGAFVYLYLLRLKNMPNVIDYKMIEFRNKVVHQGYIPKVNEVIEYGEAVFNHINLILDKLDEKFEEEMRLVVVNRIAHLLQSHDGSIPISTLSLATVLSLSSKPRKKNFRDEYSEILRNGKPFLITN